MTVKELITDLSCYNGDTPVRFMFADSDTGKGQGEDDREAFTYEVTAIDDAEAAVDENSEPITIVMLVTNDACLELNTVTAN